MDAKTAKRIAALLSENREPMLEGWSSTVGDTLRGRLAKGELSRQLQEVHLALHSAFDNGATSMDHAAAADLRDVLAELSRSRARQGFTATETAVSVFALKDALLEAMKSRTRRRWPTTPPSPRFVDRLGLFTFERYVNARDAIIIRAVGPTARAVHPGGEALGRRGRRAAHRHARLGPLPGRHGAAAAGPGGHRLAVRDPRHHRRAGRGHPGRPAHPQDRGGGPADGRPVHHLRHPAADRPDHRRRSASSSARS